MNADEILKTLRECGDCDTCSYYSCWIDEQTGDPADACDEGRLFRDIIALIESLQAKLDERNKECETQYELLAEKNQQLAASQRRADAAVEDIYKMTDGGECDICKHYNPDKNTCAKPFVPYDDCFEWRAPQEAGEVEQ